MKYKITVGNIYSVLCYVLLGNVLGVSEDSLIES